MGQSLSFPILGQSVSIEAPDKDSLRLDEILPSTRALHDAFVAAAVRRHGKPVTCAKGCSACCRIQPVPITPAEAYALLLLIDAMPADRRQVTLARFAECEASLSKAGLRDGFLEGRRPVSDDQAKQEAQQYLDLGLVCPFLEEDCCSIYAERPFACREYLVTSPKENCTNPLSQKVLTIPVAGGTACSLSAEAESLGYSAYAIPLTLAYSWAKTHQDRLRTSYEGKQVFPRAMDRFQRLWAAYFERNGAAHEVSG